MMWFLDSALGWEDPLEKGMATHSSILAWRIPWTEEGQFRRDEIWSPINLPNRTCAVLCIVVHSCPTLCDPTDYVVHQTPLSMWFSRQEYWSGLSSAVRMPRGSRGHTSCVAPSASLRWEQRPGQCPQLSHQHPLPICRSPAARSGVPAGNHCCRRGWGFCRGPPFGSHHHGGLQGRKQRWALKVWITFQEAQGTQPAQLQQNGPCLYEVKVFRVCSESGWP